MRPQAKIVADFWVDKLRAPAHHDNGEPTQLMFARMMAEMTYKPIPEERLQAFHNSLAKYVEGELDKAECGEYIYGSIGVDYHPDRPLGEALRAAGIEARFGLLPFKTRSWFGSESVRVAEGYRGEIKEIWAAKAAEEEG